MKFAQALLILSGMIMGVGMFGIPFSFAKAGFLLGTIELVLLTLVIIFFHLIYSEIVTRTKEHHRIPGYVRMYIGGRVTYLAWAATIFGIVGTLLVYLLVSARFLSHIVGPVWDYSSELFWSVFVMACIASITFFSLKKEAFINGVFTAILIGFILFLVVVLLPSVNTENLTKFDIRNIFVPYGVLLFALSGGAAIPDVVDILGRKRGLIRGAIIFGTLLPACLYFLFALVVVGVSGLGVSEESFLGLSHMVSGKMMITAYITGLLAVFTSFVVLSSNFISLLEFDFGMQRIYGWAIATLTPTVLYIFGFHNFLSIISFLGATSVGIELTLLLSVYHRSGAKLNFLSSKFRYPVEIGFYFLVIMGMVYTIANIKF